MGLPMYYTDTLTRLTCGVCGVPHAISETIHDKALSQGVQWYCPNGHHIGYNDTEVKRLKREVEEKNRAIARKEQQLSWAEKNTLEARKQRDRQERRARAFKGKVTTIKKRVGNGVCPCCNRTFQNLMAHMKTKHPKFKGKK